MASKDIKNTCDQPLFTDYRFLMVTIFFAMTTSTTIRKKGIKHYSPFLDLEYFGLSFFFLLLTLNFIGFILCSNYHKLSNYLENDANLHRVQMISYHPLNFPFPFLSENFGQHQDLRCYMNLNHLKI